MTNDTVGEGLESLLVAFAEGVGARRENFEDPHELAPIPEGNDEDGADTEQAAGGGIDARIGFGVVATLQGSDAQALGGETGVVETNAQIGSGAAGGGAAYHFAVAGESDGGAGGSGGQAGLLNDLIENQVQSQILGSISAAAGGQGAGQSANFRV